MADTVGARVGRAKDTAEMTALARAAGNTHKEGDPLKNPDHLARRFLGPKLGLLADLCRIPPLRSLIDRAYEKKAPGAARYLLARTKHFDQVLLAEIDRGLEQLVVLGAGYDTRAYRFAERLARSTVFELDHPDTARRKTALLRSTYGELPAHVRFVSIDFAAEPLEDRLREAGCDFGRRTLFLWEGVSYYLLPEAIDAVLEVIRKAAPGSSVIFDYIHQSVVDGASTAYGAAAIQAQVRQLGEPFHFGLPEGGAAAFLSARGFDLVSDLGPEEMNQRYLTRSDGTAVGRVSGFFGIAHARVT